MNDRVLLQRARRLELLIASRLLAREWTHGAVREHVHAPNGLGLKSLLANLAPESQQVPLRVRAELVAGGECLVAVFDRALERSLAGVDVLVLDEPRGVVEGLVALVARVRARALQRKGARLAVRAALRARGGVLAVAVAGIAVVAMVVARVLVLVSLYVLLSE